MARRVKTEAEWVAALRRLLDEGEAHGWRAETDDADRLRALAGDDDAITETHARHEGRTTFAWTAPAAALLGGERPWTDLQRQLSAALIALGADGVAWVAPLPDTDRIAVVLTTDADVENAAANHVAHALAGGRARFRRIRRDAVEGVMRFPIVATNAGVVYQVMCVDAPDGDEEVVNAMQLALDEEGGVRIMGYPDPVLEDFLPGLPRVRVTGAL